MYRGDRYKEAGHGPEWKYVMKVFGLEPKRTHDFDVSETSGLVLRKTKRHPVKCSLHHAYDYVTPPHQNC